MNIQIFKNDQFGEIRVVLNESGELMFVASDIARSLGYENPNEAILTHCESGSIEKRYVAHKNSTGGCYVNIIPEPELYSLIFGSKLESAKEFKKWVTCEVLPSIRKHGAYATESTIYSNKAWFEIKQEVLDNGKIIYHRRITGIGRDGIIDLLTA